MRRSPLEVRLEDVGTLAEYASIPIAFEIRERIDLNSVNAAQERLPTIRVMPPYIKDYDAIPRNDPASWPSRFDISRWTFLGAFANEQRVGGATVIAKPEQLLGEDALPSFALVWDI